MGLIQLSTAVLMIIAVVSGQYGPLKGSSSRRTTTPFPPGFQSDNQLYNSISNSITPDSNQVSHSYTYSDNSGGVHSGAFSASSSGCGDGGFGGGCGEPVSNQANLAQANKKSPAGVASYADNPWLSGIVAQNSGSGPSPTYQQASTSPTVSCSAPGHVCVNRNQCQGGQTSSPGSGQRQCNTNSEVCCQYGPQQPSYQPAPTNPPSQGPQPQPTYQSAQQTRPQPSPTYIPAPIPQQPVPTYQTAQRPQSQLGPSYTPGQRPYPSSQPGPSYSPGQRPSPSPQPGPSYSPGQRPYQAPQPGPSYSTGQRPYPAPQPGPTQGQRPQPTQGQSYYSGAQRPQPSYRPGTGGVPIGGSIYDTGAARPNPSYVTPAPIGPYTGPLNTTPHPGCPAALKCVEEIYCDAKGVMQDTPVQLTREELENKVPLSECQNIETGIIGKCCRDPNYTDPWPDMNNGLYDDGQYHGEHSGNHPNQHQFQQGTPFDSTCGPSATCTLQSQCSGGRQTQPGKQCQVPQDGSTGVCCSKPQFPSYTNNLQINKSPATPSYRPTPGQLYYTPRPPQSNNPFLPENQGRLPAFPGSNQTPIRPSGFPPANYGPSQPNAIPAQDKGYDYGKQSTPKPRPNYPAPSASSGFPRPSYPGASQQTPAPAFYPQQTPSNYPRPSYPSASQQTPVPASYPQQTPSNYPRPSYPSASQQTPAPASYPQPIPSNYPRPSSPPVSQLPVFPQIATSGAVYTPSVDTFSQSPYEPPSYTSPPKGYPSTPSPSYSGILPATDTKNPQIQSVNAISSTLSPPVAINDVKPTPEITPAKPTKGRGPPAGYPFLPQTTEPNKRPNIPTTTSSPAPEPGKDCGVRREVQRPNGPNGLETGFSEIPWQAQVLAASGQTPLCSGAILAAKVIVTAAHCVDDLKSSDLEIKAGDWKLGMENSEEELKPTQVRKVAAISRHPKYDPVSRFYDMAVLILAEPLELDSHVDVLCLGDNTPEGQKPKGSNCVVTGWGKPNLQNNAPGTTMHSLPVSFIENNQCEDIFRNTNLGKYFQLNKSFVCAVPNSPNDDLCQVDVGSPIACQKPDGHYELSGIYSWDVGCHQNPKQPMAAANVDKPWVQSVMDKPVEQVKQEEKAELEKKENLGFNPSNSDSNKPGFSQGYGKK